MALGALVLAAFSPSSARPARSKKAPAKTAPVMWMHSRQQAMAMARKTGKPVLIDVSTAWCGPCQQMKQEVFQTTAFAKEARRWVLLDLDGDAHAALAAFYGAETIPTLIVLSPHGKVVARQTGYGGYDYTMHFVRGAYAKAKK